MAFLKRKIRKFLTDRQHRNYEKTISEKKLSYEEWIEKQEEKIAVRCKILEETAKCLTNESEKYSDEGKLNHNAGFDSSESRDCRKFVVWDENGRKGRMGFLVLQCGDFGECEWQRFAGSFHEMTDVDVVVFLCAQGEPSRLCFPLLYQEFLRERVILAYGDEDVRTGEKGQEFRRERPWFKPDWSPDTFLSCFYFGSLVAVRAKPLLELLAGKGGDISSIYELCFYLIRDGGGFRKRTPGEEEPVLHIPEILFHGRREGYETAGSYCLFEESPEEGDLGNREGGGPLVSVVIPSKDNPKVLFHCLRTLFDRTGEGPSFEIIIVDNGSRGENREMTEREIEARNREVKELREDFRGIRYHYEPMEFNFSHMCNIGAGEASGELLLFLNDDMEIIQSDWLIRLVLKAVLPRAGAVGAKLLYPDSATIQHAGITNLRVGPAHKLQFLSDDEEHYYGRNRGVHNMIGATGACLMMRKKVFEEAGGFFEGLAVAFNDVDLCYTIYENGYYNIERNDVVLYHHESLSRGKDGESEEKQLRLLREKDVLYERHQELYGRDPFYHKYLTTDMLEAEYSPAFRYQVRLDMPWALAKEREGLPGGVREDACVVLGMECAMDIYKWKYGVEAGRGGREADPSDQGYYFQGYSFVIGADNACYKRTLILKEKDNGRIIEIPVEDQYRQDICDNLKDQVNVQLTGFAAKVRLSDVPKGRYRFGMLVRERCSRQKLIGFSSWVLEAGERIRQTEEIF